MTLLASWIMHRDDGKVKQSQDACIMIREKLRTCLDSTRELWTVRENLMKDGVPLPAYRAARDMLQDALRVVIRR